MTSRKSRLSAFVESSDTMAGLFLDGMHSVARTDAMTDAGTAPRTASRALSVDEAVAPRAVLYTVRRCTKRKDPVQSRHVVCSSK